MFQYFTIIPVNPIIIMFVCMWLDYNKILNLHESVISTNSLKGRKQIHCITITIFTLFYQIIITNALLNKQGKLCVK